MHILNFNWKPLTHYPEYDEYLHIGNKWPCRPQVIHRLLEVTVHIPGLVAPVTAPVPVPYVDHLLQPERGDREQQQEDEVTRGVRQELRDWATQRSTHLEWE